MCTFPMPQLYMYPKTTASNIMLPMMGLLRNTNYICSKYDRKMRTRYEAQYHRNTCRRKMDPGTPNSTPERESDYYTLPTIHKYIPRLYQIDDSCKSKVT